MMCLYVVCARVCLCAHRGQRIASGFLFYTLYLVPLRRGLSLIPELLFSAGSQQTPETLWSLPYLVLGLQVRVGPCSTFTGVLGS